jgi:hypothetical protein
MGVDNRGTRSCGQLPDLHQNLTRNLRYVWNIRNTSNRLQADSPNFTDTSFDTPGSCIVTP